MRHLSWRKAAMPAAKTCIILDSAGSNMTNIVESGLWLFINTCIHLVRTVSLYLDCMSVIKCASGIAHQSVPGEKCNSFIAEFDTVANGIIFFIQDLQNCSSLQLVCRLHSIELINSVPRFGILFWGSIQVPVGPCDSPHWQDTGRCQNGRASSQTARLQGAASLLRSQV